MREFETISPYHLTENTFRLIGERWFLITAGTIDHYNTMTGGWGHFGVIWNVPTAVIYVRPTRYTFQFMENNSYFTLSFFDKNQKYILDYCGKYSGREVNKAKELGLTPEVDSSGCIWFLQASLVVKCRKIYSYSIKPEDFIDQKIEKNYPLKDYHKQYIGEILECLTQIPQKNLISNA